MKTLERALLSFLSEHNIHGGKVAIAVSGGVDSLSLLHALHTLDIFEVHALTVDHGLRKESREEAVGVQKYVKTLGVHHTILTWESKKPTTRIQETARLKRYDLLHDYCIEHGIAHLFLGHHGGDQVETFFMRLLKGSSLHGLRGMDAMSRLREIKLLRPFLKLTKEVIFDYAHFHNLPFITDPSNDNGDFERVRVRKILDTLGGQTGILQSMDHLRAMDNLLKDVVDNALQQVACEGGIEYEGFFKLSKSLQIEVMRRYADCVIKNPYPPKFEKIHDLVAALYMKKKHTLGGYVWKVKGCVITATDEVRDEKKNSLS